jgi:hypothetical protein
MKYSFNGAYPTDRPFRVTLANGQTRTAEAVTDQILIDAGYVAIADPTYDAETQVAEWIAGAWVVRSKSPVELQQEALAGAQWQSFINACDVPEVGGNGVFAALLGINYAIAMDSYQLMLRFVSGQAGALELRTLNYLYGLLTPALAPATLTALQTAIANNNIPLSI